jgi:hypothetical protein
MVRILSTLLAVITLGACDFKKTPEPAEDSPTAGSGDTDVGTAAVTSRDAGSAPTAIVCGDASDCPADKPYCTDSGFCAECTQDAACAPEAPRCEPETNSCVQCLEDSDCGGDAPLCDLEAHVCVQCHDDDQCTKDSAPHCDEGVCGKCSKNAHCAHFEDKALCDDREDSKTEGSCVQCRKHSDCKESDAPQCEKSECVPCTEDDACQGRRGTPICNVDGGEKQAGRCVQCTPMNEIACGDNVCDAQKLTCADIPKAMTGICQPCIADSQCLDDHRCVELRFKGEIRGHYCLKRMSANCVEPFTATVESGSISGAISEAYCGINENQTTCEAVDDAIHSKQCEEADDCGIQMGDGLCERVSGQPNRCTYGCGVAAQCPTGLRCGSDEHYCL